MSVGRVTAIGAYVVVMQPVKSRLAPGEAVQFKVQRQPGEDRGEVMFETNGVSDGQFNFSIDELIYVLGSGQASVR